MVSRLIFLLKYYAFWIVFFFVQKLIFLFYYAGQSFSHLNQWPGIFFHGLRLDLSMGGYVMLFPILILLVALLFPGRWSFITLKVYSFIVLIIFSLFIAGDVALYKEWGFRLDATPLLYLKNPKDAFASVSFLYILVHLLIAGILSWVFIIIYNWLLEPPNVSSGQRLLSLPVLILVLGFMILPIRGGLGTAPINTGSAYFSQVPFVNHAGINLEWNICYSFANLETVSNPYKMEDPKSARRLFDQFTEDTGTYKHYLKTERPNIILMVLESFTANVFGCLNGMVPCTPHLDSVAKNGMLFSDFYASGDRTDKGMLAVLSGYPSQPTTSIIKFPNKTQSLPALPRVLRDNGYSTTFYYGGDIDWANFKSFLLNSGFQHLVSMSDFPESERISSWGVPDGYLLTRVAKDIKEKKSPYFITLFTLSSHPPYDVPMKPVLKGDDDQTKFCNSVFYTDRCIGRFIHELDDQQLLSNTLIIMVADHGCRWPGNLGNYPPKKFHIPMIWYGGALKQNGLVINKIASQTDIAATVLGQMDLEHKDFMFSRNLFAAGTPQKAIYAFNNGFGYVSDSVKYYYHRQDDRFNVVSGTVSPFSKLQGKAYIQTVYHDLINR